MEFQKLTIQENIPLAPLTTFKIGGPARYFVNAATKEDAADAIKRAKEKGVPVFVLGGGSNILISDAGYPGLVIKMAIGGWEFDERSKEQGVRSKVNVKVGAGVYMIPLAYESIRRGLAGLEWAGGLPGTLGGAIRGNAGAFRGEIGNHIISVEVLRDGEILTLPKEACGFVYRSSNFRSSLKDDIILSAELELEPGDPEASRKKIGEFLQHRRKSQPPFPSAGCAFKNPRFEKLEDLQENLRSILPKEYQGYKKIFAGWLIEQAGMKGRRVGGAELSPLHANFIVNTGGATSADVENLIQEIKNTVKKKFGIVLDEEIQRLR